MRSDKLQDAIGEICGAFVEDAHGPMPEARTIDRLGESPAPEETAAGRRAAGIVPSRDVQRPRAGKVRYGVAVAACLCLLIGGGITAGILDRGQLYPDAGGQPGKNYTAIDNTVQIWREGYSGQDYFLFNERDAANSASSASSSGSLSADAMPYRQTRDFSVSRAALEAEAVIPDEGRVTALKDHPLFSCEGRYHEDGTLYSVVVSWHRRGRADRGDVQRLYSDIAVTLAPEEVHEISDTVAIAVDGDGRVIDPVGTVTERGGVRILAEGRIGQEKSLSCQTENGWLKVSGSWNDSYEDVAEVFDWFFEHPSDLSRFAPERGDLITFESGVFAGMDDYLPDFSALGYYPAGGSAGTSVLRNGSFVSFEGLWVSGVTEEQARTDTYEWNEKIISVWWVVDAEPDYYEQEDCRYSLCELTEKIVEDTFAEGGQHLSFRWDDYICSLYAGSNVPAKECWRIIRSLQS